MPVDQGLIAKNTRPLVEWTIDELLREAESGIWYEDQFGLTADESNRLDAIEAELGRRREKTDG